VEVGGLDIMAATLGHEATARAAFCRVIRESAWPA
jgi:hypothetical protein